MKKTLSAIVLGSLLAPLPLLAQDASSTTANVGSTNVAPLQSILPNSYGTLDVRHYFNRKTIDDSSNRLKYDPVLQPRLNLGSKFFGERLDSKFIFGLENKHGTGSNSSIVTDKGTRLENEFTAYKNTYISFVPFLYIQFPKSTDEAEKRKPTKAEFGINIPMTYPIATNAGLLTLEAEVDGKTFFGSKPDPEDNVVVGNSKELGLTDPAEQKRRGLSVDKKENLTTPSTGRSLYTWFSFGASYKPSFASGLETRFSSVYETTYVPIMEMDKTKQTAVMRTSGGIPSYTKKFEPSYLFQVKYAFTPEYSITNEFLLMGREEGERKYSNMVSVVAKLF